MLVERARAAKAAPLEWLKMRTVHGGLAEDARFAALLSEALSGTWADGSAAAIDAYLAEG